MELWEIVGELLNAIIPCLRARAIHPIEGTADGTGVTVRYFGRPIRIEIFDELDAINDVKELERALLTYRSRSHDHEIAPGT